MSELSKKDQLALLSPEEQQDFLNSLTEEEAEHLLYDWEFNGRPKQLEGFTLPEFKQLYDNGNPFQYSNDWDFWLILAGRGFGKTRTGAEWVRYQVEVQGRKRIGILGPTSADLRDVIVEGDSGILQVSHPSNRPIFEPTKRRVTWPNGAIATLYSAEEPERLRGPQHDALWCLTPDTLVATQLGEVRIDQLEPTLHKIWTPWGLRKLYNKILTNQNADITVVSTPNGLIKGTRSHLVYDNGTFKPLEKLKCVTYVENIWEKCITSERQVDMNSEGSGWLEWSTKMKLARYLPGMRYTIRTLTARMIQFRIWRCSHQKSTTQNTHNNDLNKIRNATLKLRQLWSTVLIAAKNLKRRFGEKTGSNSALGNAWMVGEDQSLSQKNVNARFVIPLTQQLNIFKNTVQNDVTPKREDKDVQILSTRNVKIEKSPCKSPVYDIGVEGGVFFANGFLVHNCDEIAGWANGNPEVVQRAWDMAMFGLRLGKHPQVCITTTPKPIPLIQMFIKWAKDPKRKLLLTTGSTYDNKSNLAPSFYNQIAMYEGTALGRQEIHAEVLNLEEQGILKRSWFKLWRNSNELPNFIYIIQSYDTAFTEKTHNDPTACTVWGVFLNDEGLYCVMLLDAWTDHLQYPDLRARVIEEYKATYGGEEDNPLKPGHRPDIVLIEEKGSGITLCQDLQRAGVPARPYNPGRMDKVQRLHTVSHIVAAGRVYIPESTKVPGEFRTWATEFITEICTFPLALHDDYTDTLSQALTLLRDQTWLSIDPEVVEEDYDYHESKQAHRNPYAV